MAGQRKTAFLSWEVFAFVFSLGSMHVRAQPKVYLKRREKQKEPNENYPNAFQIAGEAANC